MNKDKLQKQLEEAKQDLATLKKMKASADEIEFQESEIKDIEEQLKSADSDKKTSEPSGKKRGRKPKVKEVSLEPKEKGKRGRKPDPLKKEKALARKSKGLSVVYDGVTYHDTDPKFCEIMLKQLEERKKKRQEASGKVKTTSLSTKVGHNISSSVVTAIKGAFNENKDGILDNKTSANKFLKTIERIESAADKFVKEMKSILADSFKQRDFDREFKEVDEVIKKIKETIKKSV